jgi:formylglycine-generating enzyme required for sulfatase activity
VGVSTLAETWLNGGELDLPASAIYATPPPNVTAITRNTDELCAQELLDRQILQQFATEFIGYVTSETIVDAKIAEGLPIVKLSPPVFAEEIAAAFDKASSLPTESLRAEVDRLFTAMHNDGRLSELSIKWYNADWTKAPDTSPSISTVAPTSTPEPFGIGSTVVWPQDGMTLLYVPAGEFRMGITGQESDEKPVHVVSLDAFWIDQTEVTNSMYALCVNESQCNRPGSFRSRTRSSYYSSKEFGDYPVIHISWEDARSYCEWVGRRLPTEAEWEKAARGLDQRNYPWGEGIDCSLANYYDGKTFCVGDTSLVKSYESGMSPYGAYDMAGNVWEWVADWYVPDYYDISPASNPPGPATGELRVARGGSWEDTDFLARTSNRGSFAPGGRNDARGFRCAFSE